MTDLVLDPEIIALNALMDDLIAKPLDDALLRQSEELDQKLETLRKTLSSRINNIDEVVEETQRRYMRQLGELHESFNNHARHSVTEAESDRHTFAESMASMNLSLEGMQARLDGLIGAQASFASDLKRAFANVAGEGAAAIERETAARQLQARRFALWLPSAGLLGASLVEGIHALVRFGS